MSENQQPETVTTVTYTVEEHVPYSKRWVAASSPCEDKAEAEAMRAQWLANFPNPEHFRIVKTTTVTTAEIL